MAQRNYSFDIEPVWGTHTRMLGESLASLPAGSLVIEHGAGMYSGPLIARHDVQIICIEEAPGWRSWAQWLFADRAMMLARAKEAVPYLVSAALVFIDGAARQRGDLLKWSLAAGCPLIIAHDTQDPQYAYDLNFRRDYAIEHDDGTPRTTRWTKTGPL